MSVDYLLSVFPESAENQHVSIAVGTDDLTAFAVTRIPEASFQRCFIGTEGLCDARLSTPRAGGDTGVSIFLVHSSEEMKTIQATAASGLTSRVFS